MVDPVGQVKKHGATNPVAIHGHRESDDRWYPVLATVDGELCVAIIKPVDEITGAVMTIDSFHHEIHEGETFVATQIDTNLANNGELTFHLTPGPTFSHLVFNGTNGGDATIELLEDPTVVGGVAVSERNMKRTSAEPGDTVVLSGVTVNVVGTTVFDCVIPGGTGGNAAGGVLGLRDNSEFILDPDKTYVVRLTNIAGNAKAACLIIQWYEESDN